MKNTNTLFENAETNLQMLEGSYKKLKSYYYYNKNYLIMREKIAYFEADENNMRCTFEKLSDLLMKPNDIASADYFKSLLQM
jgi:hypothetical protein